MTIKCNGIVFDCDGVLLDSNALKTQAFKNVLQHYSSTSVDKFIDYHQKNGGISRYVKLRHFFTDILNIPVDETQLTLLLESFSNECKILYQIAPLTPNCLYVLENLYQNTPLHVASGSAEDELREVFLQRGLYKFFKEIYGSPKTKTECVQKIVRGLDTKENILLIGDAESDWKAAQQANINFIFMSQFSEVSSVMSIRAEKEGFMVIKNLNDLLPILSF